MCLIPEVNFDLKGEHGLFAYVEKVLESRGHAVICLAEGAGQVSPVLIICKTNCSHTQSLASGQPPLASASSQRRGRLAREHELLDWTHR